MTMQEVTSEWVSEAAPDPSACVGLSPGLGAVGHGMCQHPGTQGGGVVGHCGFQRGFWFWALSSKGSVLSPSAWKEYLGPGMCTKRVVRCHTGWKWMWNKS